MQPYRQNTFGLRGSLKPRAKYYAPFKVLEMIGRMAYKIQLPDDAHIHPVFHVSQLKKHIGNNAIPIPELPLVGPDGKVKTIPVEILQRRVVPTGNEPMVPWSIHWENRSREDATWEEVAFM